MHIVHIITGLNNGGAEGVLYRLCKNDKYYKHTVISLMDMGKYGPFLIKEGMDVYCLNMKQGKLSFHGLIQLYQILRRIKPDVVQTWMYHADLIGGLIAKLAGVKKIYWNIRHSVLEKGKSKRSTMLIAQLCAQISSFIPYKIICCAKKALDIHVEKGYQANKMVVIGNGYELEKFLPSNLLRSKIKEELKIQSTENIIGMVGRFDPLKDHFNLLAALAIVKNKFGFKCLLVGKELNQSNYELCAAIDKFGLQNDVLLLDQRSDIPSIMNALDIHVLSSSSEAFPNVLAEAMACGTPCVTTDVGDAALIVGNAGWIVPSCNSEKLAEGIIQALECKQNLEQWQKKKIEARNLMVEKFSIENMIGSYHDLWSH